MSMSDVVAVAEATEAAAARIQRILLALDDELLDFGVKVEAIEVDTRRFAGMGVNITVEAR